jgi:hypothetical protein
MKLINYNFTKLFNNNFLTENMAFFLFSIVKIIRPLKILEFGYGYTTLFFLESIKDIKEEIFLYNNLVKTSNFNTFSGKNYEPELIVVDNFLDIDDFEFNKELEKIKMLSLEKPLTIVKCNMKDYLENVNEKYDLIFIDAGSKKDYIDYFKYIDNMINIGGLIIIHSTLTNKEGQNFLKNFNDTSYEKMSLIEPHKKWQNSFTMFKKKCEYPTYTEIA